MSRSGWRPYVSVAQRRRQAAKKIAGLRGSGREFAPVAIEGRRIATTFWGIAWCDNLEAYSDYANRLPRGRTYVRNGSVFDLQIAKGRISALVSGSEIYEVDLRVKPLPATRWKRVRSHCAGRIDSVVELLQGRISDAVMGTVTKTGEGLFPMPREISLDCSCPDWATMCKHVAAVLYGVGARLDHKPEMLFTLRGVDPAEMVGEAVGQAAAKGKAARGRVLAPEDLSSVFGVDIDLGTPAAAATPKADRSRWMKAGKKVAKKKPGGRPKVIEGTAGRRSAKQKPEKNSAASRKKPTSSRRRRGDHPGEPEIPEGPTRPPGSFSAPNKARRHYFSSGKG